MAARSSGGSSYAGLLTRGLVRTEQDEAIRSQLEKTLQTVEAAIARKRLGI